MRPDRYTKSIELRLSVQLGLLFLVFAIVCGGIVGDAVTDIDETARYLRLQQQLNEIQLLVRSDQDPVGVDLTRSEPALFKSDTPQRFYAIFTPNLTLVTSSFPKLARDLITSQAAHLRQPTHTVFESSISGSTMFFMSRPLVLLGERFILAVGDRSRADDDLLANVETKLVRRIAVVTIPAVLLVVLISAAMIRMCFKPVRILTRDAEQVGPDTPGRRLETGRIPTEFVPVVEAANGAMDRLEKMWQSQRRFTADAAHQLLTPVAVLAARVDITPGLADKEGFRRDISRMRSLIRQLVNLARIQSNSEPRRSVDLRATGRSSVQALAPLAISQGKSLSFSDQPGSCFVWGDPLAIDEALCNLVHNALLHTEPGHDVEVRVIPPETIAVLDEGPGVPNDQTERIFDPFYSTSGGSGLGLAIVAEIMTQHGGRASVTNRPAGGAAFMLHFPVHATSMVASGHQQRSG